MWEVVRNPGFARHMLVAHPCNELLAVKDGSSGSIRDGIVALHCCGESICLAIGCIQAVIGLESVAMSCVHVQARAGTAQILHALKHVRVQIGKLFLFLFFFGSNNSPSLAVEAPVFGGGAMALAVSALSFVPRVTSVEGGKD
jgi:hypothetical protein